MRMKTHTKEIVGLQKSGAMLFCSSDNVVAARLADALGDVGMLVQEVPSTDALARRLGELSPKAVFLDFTLQADEPGKLLRSADLARLLARVAPTVPRIAVGMLAQPQGTLAAMRAGLTEFVDPFSAADEVHEVLQRLLQATEQVDDKPTAHRSVLLLGARAGVGTSTMAVHLAGILQERLAQAAVARNGAADRPMRGPVVTGSALPLADRVGIMDLGWPVGDCQLYLNVSSEFDVVEAVRNLRRLDATLLTSALAHTDSGVSVVSLPRDMAAMREVSQPDSLLLFDRLRHHFGFLLADAGGFNHPEFVAGLARGAQQTWLVTDQSVGSLVSLAGVIKELTAQHVDLSHLRLVVNKYDERYGMTAQQIADRFGLQLVGTLPDRTLQLIVCTNQGKLLHEVSERDTYVRALQQIADVMTADFMAPNARGSWLSGWLPGVHRRLVTPNNH